MKPVFLVITAVFFFSVMPAQTIWTTDKNHTQLLFGAIHLGIAPVEGSFKTFEVSMKSEKEDFTDAKIELTVDVKSINTQVEMRDNDLRSSNWFDVKRFPKLVFKSTSFKKVSGKNYKLSGNITIHGITKPIVFDVVFNGWAVNMSKKQTAGFTVTGKLNRSDFNLGNKPIITGVRDEIKLRANVEIIKN